MDIADILQKFHDRRDHLRKELDRVTGAIEMIEMWTHTPAVPENGYTREEAVPQARTRRQQVIDYLTEHGPSRTEDIVRDLGIPRGTIYNVIGKSPEFQKLKKGLWALKKQS